MFLDSLIDQYEKQRQQQTTGGGVPVTVTQQPAKEKAANDFESKFYGMAKTFVIAPTMIYTGLGMITPKPLKKAIVLTGIAYIAYNFYKAGQPK